MHCRIFSRMVHGGAIFLVFGALALGSTPALATDQCDGAPSTCVTVSAHVDLSRSGTESRDLSCPSSYTFYWGGEWTRSSAAVSVAWANNFNDRTPGSASFTATNWNPIRQNWADFYIGCISNDPGTARHPADRPGSPLFDPRREPEQQGQ